MNDPSVGARSTAAVPLAAGSMLAAGALHFAIAPEHAAHALGHAALFVVLGVIQVVWAVAFLHRPSARLGGAGLALAAASIVLWTATRAYRAPFEEAPEPVELFGIATKVVEGIGLMALAVHLVGAPGPTGRAAPFVAGMVVLGVVVGVAGYAIGLVAEPYLPSLGRAAELGHREPAGHGADEGADGTATEPRHVTVHLHDNPFHIAPERIEAHAGEALELTVVNDSGTGVLHDVVVCPGDEGPDCAEPFAQTPLLPAGATARLELTVPEDGTLAYYCSVPGHRAGGMAGTLTVGADEPAGGTAGPGGIAALAALSTAAAAARRRW